VVQDRAILTMTDQYSATLNDAYSRLQGQTIIWCSISQKRYEIHSFNGIL